MLFLFLFFLGQFNARNKSLSGQENKIKIVYEHIIFMFRKMCAKWILMKRARSSHFLSKFLGY